MVTNFWLNDRQSEEPIGWDDFELSMRRRDVFHGMQFEASTSKLEFYGPDADYLVEQKELYGIDANVVFRAEICDEQVEVISGRLNFGQYSKTCGTSCRVAIPVEEEGCAVVFQSRYDQKVDLDALTSFDKVTAMPDYAGLGVTIEIPAKALQAQIEGYVSADKDIVDVTTANVAVQARFIVRPTYADERFNSLATGQLQPFGNYELEDQDFAQPISPQLLYEDNLRCFSGEIPYEFRLKGSYLVDSFISSDNVSYVKLKIVTWDGVGTIFDDGIVLNEYDVAGDAEVPVSGTFDQTFTGSIAPVEGATLYGFIEFMLNPGVVSPFDVHVEFDPETYVNIEAVKLCPPTPSKAYLIHETISKVAEAVTDRCLRAYSEYYGRTDSQPFAFPEDGCGGIRMLTSGLMLRQAPDAKFFASPKDLIEGLRGIDNIGYSIEPDPEIPGKFILRIEPVDYFYQDRQIFEILAIARGVEDVQSSQYISLIKAGYKNWEVQEVNGLGEINSTREYRTSLQTVSNTLDLTSDLVTGSYPIEVTRTQTFAETGAADTTYDNMTFLICLDRDAYSFHVEQGNITGAVNIFDPPTVLNYRLTPVRNLLRWFKSIANSYPSLVDSAYRLFFSQGTGNYQSSGELSDADCKLEIGVLAENQDISVTSFADQAEATPLWRPEYESFDYPLTVGEYLALKADPYGWISYQCGNGAFKQGFIQEIRFRPAKGMASFVLKRKW